MGSFSIWHWLVVIAIVLLLFGGGRVSNLMGDLAKGVKAFKKGMREDDDEPVGPRPDTPKLASETPKPAPQPNHDEAARH